MLPNDQIIRYCPYCGCYGMVKHEPGQGDFIDVYSCRFCLNEWKITVSLTADDQTI